MEGRSTNDFRPPRSKRRYDVLRKCREPKCAGRWTRRRRFAFARRSATSRPRFTKRRRKRHAEIPVILEARRLLQRRRLRSHYESRRSCGKEKIRLESTLYRAAKLHPSRRGGRRDMRKVSNLRGRSSEYESADLRGAGSRFLLL